MTDRLDDIAAVRAADPVSPEMIEAEVDAPWAAALRACIPEPGVAPPSPVGGRRRRPARGTLLATAALVLAGGGTVAAVTTLMGTAETVPDTPAGREAVTAYLRHMEESTPLLTGDDPAQFNLRLDTLRAVFSQVGRHGEYTVWTVSAKKPGGGAWVFSSPLLGISGIHGAPIEEDPAGSFVRSVSGGVNHVVGVRENHGRVSADVVRLEAVLADGSRRATPRPDNGWFVYSQPAEDAAPTAFVGYDAQGREVARTTRPVS